MILDAGHFYAVFRKSKSRVIRPFLLDVKAREW